MFSNSGERGGGGARGATVAKQSKQRSVDAQKSRVGELWSPFAEKFVAYAEHGQKGVSVEVKTLRDRFGA